MADVTMWSLIAVVYLMKYCNLTPAAQLLEVHEPPIFIQCPEMNQTRGKSAAHSSFLGLSPSYPFSYSEAAWEVTPASLWLRGPQTLLT